MHLWENVISGKKFREESFLTLEFKNIMCNFACKSTRFETWRNLRSRLYEEVGGEMCCLQHAEELGLGGIPHEST